MKISFQWRYLRITYKKYWKIDVMEKISNDSYTN